MTISHEFPFDWCVVSRITDVSKSYYELNHMKPQMPKFNPGILKRTVQVTLVETWRHEEGFWLSHRVKCRGQGGTPGFQLEFGLLGIWITKKLGLLPSEAMLLAKAQSY